MAVFSPLDSRKAECEKTRRENVASRHWNCLEIEGEVNGLPLPFQVDTRHRRTSGVCVFLGEGRGGGNFPRCEKHKEGPFSFLTEILETLSRFFTTGEDASWVGEDCSVLGFWWGGGRNKFKEKPTVHTELCVASHAARQNPICKWKAVARGYLLQPH